MTSSGEIAGLRANSVRWQPIGAFGAEQRDAFSLIRCVLESARPARMSAAAIGKPPKCAGLPSRPPPNTYRAPTISRGRIDSTTGTVRPRLPAYVDDDVDRVLV